MQPSATHAGRQRGLLTLRDVARAPLDVPTRSRGFESRALYLMDMNSSPLDVNSTSEPFASNVAANLPGIFGRPPREVFGRKCVIDPVHADTTLAFYDHHHREEVNGRVE